MHRLRRVTDVVPLAPFLIAIVLTAAGCSLASLATVTGPPLASPEELLNDSEGSGSSMDDAIPGNTPPGGCGVCGLHLASPDAGHFACPMYCVQSITQ